MGHKRYKGNIGIKVLGEIEGIKEIPEFLKKAIFINDKVLKLKPALISPIFQLYRRFKLS